MAKAPASRPGHDPRPGVGRRTVECSDGRDDGEGEPAEGGECQGRRHACRAAATHINRLLAEYAAPPRLVNHAGWDWHLHVDSADDAPWAEWLASSSLALATLLVGAGGVPWGECAADGCERVFVHDGRGAERRYCSTICSTRERVRRHRTLTV